MPENHEGHRVPNVTFRVREDHEWRNVTTEDVFAGKTVVVFSLPGAFTPTCSSSHVPRYNQLAAAFKDAGVDDIVCVSVNDSFVMNEWKRSQNADNVTFIPDGNGDFTRGMGMLVDKADLGFGMRSWRYSMLVKDGVVEKMFVEPERPGDPFELSDADTMLDYVAPQASRPLDITVFSRPGCEYCAKAKSLLLERGLAYEELVLNRDFTDRSLRAVAGGTTFPQIFVNGSHIGGADDLEIWLAGSHAA